MNLGRAALTMAVCFSVATMLAEAALLGVLWKKGKLHRGAAADLLAVAYDVDLPTMWRELEVASRPIKVERVSFAEMQEARKLARLDLDLREIAADKGLIDVRQLDDSMARERAKYDAMKQDFDSQIERARQGAVDASLQEVQRQIESLDSRLAKDQVLRILNDDDIDPELAMQFVVSMFKNMPLDKRKKILAEFQSPAEAQQLQDILRQIRLGVPDVDVIRRARKQMETIYSR